MLPEVGQKIRTTQHTLDENDMCISLKAKGEVIEINDHPFHPIVMQGLNEQKDKVTLHVRKDGWTNWEE